MMPIATVFGPTQLQPEGLPRDTHRTVLSFDTSLYAALMSGCLAASTADAAVRQCAEVGKVSAGPTAPPPVMPTKSDPPTAGHRPGTEDAPPAPPSPGTTATDASAAPALSGTPPQRPVTAPDAPSGPQSAAQQVSAPTHRRTPAPVGPAPAPQQVHDAPGVSHAVALAPAQRGANERSLPVLRPQAAPPRTIAGPIDAASPDVQRSASLTPEQVEGQPVSRDFGPAIGADTAAGDRAPVRRSVSPGPEVTTEVDAPRIVRGAPSTHLPVARPDAERTEIPPAVAESEQRTADSPPQPVALPAVEPEVRQAGRPRESETATPESTEVPAAEAPAAPVARGVEEPTLPHSQRPEQGSATPSGGGAEDSVPGLQGREEGPSPRLSAHRREVEAPAPLEPGLMPDQAGRPATVAQAEPVVTLREPRRAAGGEGPTDRPQRLVVEVDPPELGRCELELSMHEGRVRAVLVAERPETVAVLRLVEGQVREQLLARELQVAEFDVRQGAGQSGRQHPGQDGGHSAGRGASGSSHLPRSGWLPPVPEHAEAAHSRPRGSRVIDLVA